ncbi:MAG TPA: glycosyltransferase [Candidatus Dormibacteraeota bacterium]|nr:glycosyltransferase [Candidatus Dormibacteraeota bacterium]
MSDICFLMLPEPGHLLPTLRVASLLKQRGHRIRYITTSEYAPFLGRLGFDCVPVLSFLTSMRQELVAIAETSHAGVQVLSVVLAYCATNGISLEQLIIREIKSLQTDCILVDSAFGPVIGHLLNAFQRFRFVRLSTAFQDFFRPKPLSTKPGKEFSSSTSFVNVPEIVLCPRELDLPNTSHGERSYFVEPSVFCPRIDQQFNYSKVAISKQLIYFSLGTQSTAYTDSGSLLASVVSAFRDLSNRNRYQLIVSVGGHMDPAAITCEEANILAFRSVPQLEIIKRASLVITHGGLGTIKESILNGVPMLVFPFLNDQPANADRVEHHCLGRKCSVDAIGSLPSTIEEVATSEHIHHAVKRMQTIFRRYEETTPSISLIEGLLKSGVAPRTPLIC